MYTHLLRAELDPLPYIERLPLPSPYPFEQCGNLCFTDHGVEPFDWDAVPPWRLRPHF